MRCPRIPAIKGTKVLPNSIPLFSSLTDFCFRIAKPTKTPLHPRPPYPLRRADRIGVDSANNRMAAADAGMWMSEKLLVDSGRQRWKATIAMCAKRRNPNEERQPLFSSTQFSQSGRQSQIPGKGYRSSITICVHSSRL